MDVTRFARTDLVVVQEKEIDDYSNVFSSIRVRFTERIHKTHSID